MTALHRVLVIEDGTEYSDLCARFLAARFAFTRAGDGPAALAALAARPYDAALLDMRFDRATTLLGDPADALDRAGGDPATARRFLEDHQGLIILGAVREAGHALPVLLSHDFGHEPRRWANLHRRYAPVAYLSDAATPLEMADAIGLLIEGRGGARPSP